MQTTFNDWTAAQLHLTAEELVGLLPHLAVLVRGERRVEERAEVARLLFPCSH